jgi:hypothetical protein
LFKFLRMSPQVLRGRPGAELRTGDIIRIRNQHYGNKPYVTHYQATGQTWLTTTDGGKGAQNEWVVHRI